jgi:hypothetical protein
LGEDISRLITKPSDEEEKFTLTTSTTSPPAPRVAPSRQPGNRGQNTSRPVAAHLLPRSHSPSPLEPAAEQSRHHQGRGSGDLVPLGAYLGGEEGVRQVWFQRSSLPVRFVLPAPRWRQAAPPPRPLIASPTFVPLSLAGFDLETAAPPCAARAPTSRRLLHLATTGSIQQFWAAVPSVGAGARQMLRCGVVFS